MKGFSLIELMVVVAIMAILAGIGFGIFSGVQKSARDAKRKADVDAIIKAYEAKYDYGKGEYVAIVDSDFTSGKIPKEADEVDYHVDFSEGNKALVVCSNRLEKDSPVYCKYSANGDISTLETPAPYAAPTPTAAPTTVPTPTPTPRLFKYAFVTNDTMTGNLGGLNGADSICQAKANTKSLPGTYKAWISDQATDASSRLSHSSLPYRNIDNSIVADNWTDLTNGGLSGPFRTENGQVLPGGGSFVWTNTQPNGNKIPSSNCNNWTSNSNASSFYAGDAGVAVYNQSFWTQAATRNCDIPARLYCLEQ